jgi:hypothetical protein
MYLKRERELEKEREKYTVYDKKENGGAGVPRVLLHTHRGKYVLNDAGSKFAQLFVLLGPCIDRLK